MAQVNKEKPSGSPEGFSLEHKLLCVRVDLRDANDVFIPFPRMKNECVGVASTYRNQYGVLITVSNL